MEEPKAQAENSAENNNKVKIEYDKNINKLVAIVGGKENLLPKKKVKGSLISTIVEGLLKEDKEALEKSIKDGLKALLEKKVQCDKEIKAKKEELDKLEIAKNKEFNEACKQLFSKIDNVEQLERDYIATLGTTNPG